ncbi:MAG TPA: hypothetical protein P5081_02010 [Phycisphaerae bacterium]|nr:hypothetical protein [Phycisphaerae bacterium]HRW51630.1 hypothetical protein [Phycisphaerae bacterium]
MKRTGGHPGKRRRSATIIETVAAIVILSIALPGLISAFAEASHQSIRPYQQSIASMLAVERMEEIIARRCRGTDGYDAVTTANFPAESPVSGFPAFSRTVSVSYVDSALNAAGSDQGYKLVTVKVSGAGAEIDIERVFADF